MNRSVKSVFTLIELLVVIAIIAVLASLLLPALSSARERGRRAVCLSNQKQLYLAAYTYSSDFDGLLPAYEACLNVCYPPVVRPHGTDSSMEFVYWVMEYVKPRGYFNNWYRFEDRGILACPSNRTAKSDWNGNYWDGRVGYWPAGFGPGSYGQSGDNNNRANEPIESRFNARIEAVAKPANGIPKIFFMDMLWTLYPPPAFLSQALPKIGHNKSKRPQGQNVIAGDGSGAWIPWKPRNIADIYRGPITSGFQIPQGYWFGYMWGYGNGTPSPRISYVGPTGGLVTTNDPTKIEAKAKLWR